MATSKSRRPWLYACLFVAGAANAPIFYRLVTPSEVEPVASAPLPVEAKFAPEPEPAPVVALLGTQLNASNYPAQLMADSAREEAPVQSSSASAGGLPSTVGLVGGGSWGGGYGGGAGGGGMPGRSAPGFAGGGGGGSPGTSRPHGPVAAAPAAAPARASNVVTKPQPRLLVAEGSESQSGGPPAPGGTAAPRSALPPRGTLPVPDLRAPTRPSEDEDTLPNISSPQDASQPEGASPLRRLEEGDTTSEDDTGTDDKPGILAALDSALAYGPSVTETLYPPGAGHLGPALAEIEQRVADATDQLIATGVGLPSPSGNPGRESAKMPGNLEPLAALVDTNQVPEPMTLALLALGVGLIAAQRRRLPA